MTPTSRHPATPSTSIHTGPTLPAWTLHVALAVAMLGAVSAATVGTALPGTSYAMLLVGLLLAAAYAVRRPSLIPAAAALTATGLACLVLTPTDQEWRAPVLIASVHLVVRLSWFTTSSRPGARIEVAVLRHEATTFLTVNLVGQAVGVVAVVLTALERDGVLGRSGLLGIVGAVALLVLTGVLVARSSRTA